MMESRTEIIGMCRREASANLQRHIRSRSTSVVKREYVMAGTRSSRSTRPLTTLELLLMVGLAMFTRVP